MVMFIYCWLALGFVAAGLTSGTVIPLLGWRIMFVIGGVLPLIVLAFLAALLPESPTFLMGRPGGLERIQGILRHLAPEPTAGLALALEPGHQEAMAGRKNRSRTMALLGRTWVAYTILLWVAFAANLAAFYAIQSWLPAIVVSQGQSASVVIAAAALLGSWSVAARSYCSSLPSSAAPASREGR